MKRTALALALSALSVSAMAAPTLSISGNYSVGGNAATAITPVATATGEEFFIETTNGPDDVNRVAIQVAGQTGATASFGTNISGATHFAAETLISYSDIVINATQIAQSYTLNFNIDDSALGFDMQMASSATGQATRQIQLTVDGSLMSEDLTTISLSGNTASCTDETNGGVLGAYSGCSTPTALFSNATAQTFAIALGVLQPGQSLALNLDYLTRVSYHGTRGGGCDVIDVPGGTGSNCGGALGIIGDPLNLNANSPVFQVSATAVGGNPVPEPATLSLLAGAGILLASRRKKQPTQS